MRSAVFQDAVSSSTRVFGRKAVEVVFSGNHAETNGNVVMLPALPASAEINLDQAAVIRGYRDHEAMHVRCTDTSKSAMAELNKITQGDKLMGELVQYCEDVRIENAGISEYPGMKGNLSAVNMEAAKVFLSEVEKVGDAKDILAGMGSDMQLKVCLQAIARQQIGVTSGGLYESMIDHIRVANPKLVEFCEQWAPKLASLPTGYNGNKLVETTSKKGTWAAFDMAREVHAGYLKLFEKPPEPPAPPPQPQPREKGDNGDDKGEHSTEGSPTKQKPENKDKGDGKGNEDGGDGKGTEEDQRDNGDQGSGDSQSDQSDGDQGAEDEDVNDGVTDDSDDDDDDGDGEAGDQGDDGQGEDQGDGGDADDQGGDQGQPGDQSSDDGGDDAGDQGGGGIKAERGDGDGDGSGDSDGQGDTDAGDPSDMQQGNSNGGGEIGSRDPGNGQFDMSKIGPPDFSKALQGVVGEINKRNDGAPIKSVYRPLDSRLSYKDDLITLLSTWQSPYSGDATQAEVRNAHLLGMANFNEIAKATTGKRALIRRLLELELQARDDRRWEGGHTRGRLQSIRLVDAVQGRERVFQARHDGKDMNTVLMMSIDGSGSMTGRSKNRMFSALGLAYALSEALEKTGCDIEVSMWGNVVNSVHAPHALFETVTRQAMDRGNYREFTSSGLLARGVIKGLRERVTSERVQQKFGTAMCGMHSGTPFWDAIFNDLHDLAALPHKKKVYLMLTDGEADDPWSGDETKPALIAEYKALAVKNNIHLVGVGIAGMEVGHLFSDHISVQGADAYEPVIKLLAKIIAKEVGHGSFRRAA